MRPAIPPTEVGGSDLSLLFIAKLTLPVTGSSMGPFLRQGRDRVVLVKADASALKKGDVPLYIRRDGQYVLHRIVAIDNGTYTMCGDAQRTREPGICPDQIVAVAKGFYHKEKYVSCDGFGYRCYTRLWMGLPPLRSLLFAGRMLVRRAWPGKHAV